MNILVIDDERDIRQLITYALKADGYHVTAVSNVEEAEHLIITKDWDLVISDVMIPHMGGFEIVELVKACKNIPVILLTGLDEDILYSTHSNADLIITKPVTRQQLMNSVKLLCTPADSQ